jgi:hypothetical protein
LYLLAMAVFAMGGPLIAATTRGTPVGPLWASGLLVAIALLIHTVVAAGRRAQVYG